MRQQQQKACRQSKSCLLWTGSCQGTTPVAAWPQGECFSTMEKPCKQKPNLSPSYHLSWGVIRPLPSFNNAERSTTTPASLSMMGKEELGRTGKKLKSHEREIHSICNTGSLALLSHCILFRCTTPPPPEGLSLEVSMSLSSGTTTLHKRCSVFSVA